jgi:hypothetical protein
MTPRQPMQGGPPVKASSPCRTLIGCLGVIYMTLNWLEYTKTPLETGGRVHFFIEKLPKTAFFI